MNKPVYPNLKEFISSIGNNTDLPRIIEKQYPELFSNAGFTSFMYSSLSDAEKADAVQAAFSAVEYAEDHRPHRKNVQTDYYSLYRKFAHPDMLLTRKAFSEAFDSFFDVVLTCKELDCRSKVLNAIQSLQDIGESQSEILAFLDFSLLHPADNYIPSLSKEESKDADHEMTRYNMYNQAGSQIRPIKINILDSVCAALTNYQINDVSLENTSILYNFIKIVGHVCKASSTIVIIEPSAYLVRQLKSNNPMREHRIIFVMDNTSLTSIYSHYFNGLFEFAPRRDFLSDVETGKLTPDAILMFGNHIIDSEKKAEYVRCLKYSTRKSFNLSVFDSDFHLENIHTLFKKSLLDLSLEHVWLYPSGIHNATTPTKKMLLSFKYDIENPTESDFHVIHYSLVNGKNYQVLRPYFFQAVLPNSVYRHSEASLRSIFNDQRNVYQSKESYKRNLAETFYFTKEISVFYTFSGAGSAEKPYRLEVYVKNPFTNEKIYDSKKSTKKITPSTINLWIKEKYLKDETVRNLISATYSNLLKGKDITLRTMIYINVSWEQDFSKRELDIVQEISESELGVLSLGQISPELIDEILSPEEKTYRHKITLLSRILEFAKSQGRIDENPLDNHNKKLFGRNSELFAVRFNLTKKHYNAEQFKKIFKLLIKRASSGNTLNLAALICLLTGLHPNVVLAMKLKDIRVLSFGFEISFLQFYVRRQLTNDGSEIKPFVRIEQCRKIPCPETLTNFIQKKMKSVRDQNQGLPEEYIMDQFIFTDNRKIIAPETLTKELKKTHKKLAIPSDLVLLPDSKKGTVETDLAYYGGNIFHTNFDFYARHVGRFELDELQYFQGLQVSTTFSRHYCNFEQDDSQLILHLKLERIIKSVLMDDLFRSEKKAYHSSSNLEYITQPSMHNRSLLSMDLTISGEVSFTIDSLYGSEISIQEVDYKNDN